MEDGGTGMSRQVLAKALEPFFTTKDVGKGSGLGLSMVYGFARQSGGTLQLDSAPGSGTTVTLLFPLLGRPSRPGESAFPGEEDLPAHGAWENEEILVVEDDDAVREIVVEMLRDLGFRTREAGTGQEALALLEAEAPDLVLSDVVLPGGQDGAQLAREVSRLHPHLPVLLMSGYPREALAHREGMGEVELLSKPYSKVALGRAVARLLDGSRARRSRHGR